MYQNWIHDQNYLNYLCSRRKNKTGPSTDYIDTCNKYIRPIHSVIAIGMRWVWFLFYLNHITYPAFNICLRFHIDWNTHWLFIHLDVCFFSTKLCAPSSGCIVLLLDFSESCIGFFFLWTHSAFCKMLIPLSSQDIKEYPPKSRLHHTAKASARPAKYKHINPRTFSKYQIVSVIPLPCASCS